MAKPRRRQRPGKRPTGRHSPPPDTRQTKRGVATFLDHTVTLTLSEDARTERTFHFCVVPEKHYPTVSKALDIIGGIREDRELWGMTVRFGQTLFVVVPDTVEVRTLAHEAVHLAVEFGLSSDKAEEDFAVVVGHLTADMHLAIETLRGAVVAQQSKRRTRKS